MGATADIVEVRFEPEGRTVRVPARSTLLDAARAAGVPIDARCDGKGTCGACRVRATGDLSGVTRDEEGLLGRSRTSEGVRLACRAQAVGDVVVEHVVSETSVRVAFDTVGAGEAPGGEAALGAAVDIGTTTIAIVLIDLGTKADVARAGALNAQFSFGADVMTRAARAVAGDAERLRVTVTEQVEGLLLEALDRAGSASDVLVDMVVVGNTAMTGLFLGRDLTALTAAPYEGAPVSGAELAALALGMTAFPHARVRVLPGVSAFVGSDVVAGLLATGLVDGPRPVLLVDLGTNGEIVLAAGGEVLATSAAAGPALEGASLSSGMRAENGAIESVILDGEDLALGVIGGGAPRGVCGSGVLDLLRVLLDTGVIDASGLMRTDAPSILAGRVRERDGVRAFMLHPDVWFTQLDVRQAQLAIAAVRTGVDALLAVTGTDPRDVVKVVLAGGFGTHADPASVGRVGLLPGSLAGRVTFAGNTAVAGARMALTETEWYARAVALAGRVRAVNLAAHADFPDRFMRTLSGVFAEGFDIQDRQ